MEDMDTAGVMEWLRSMKLDDAAAICFTHEIDGFVFMALLEEESGLDSIGITKTFDRAKVRGGVRRRISEVTISKLPLTQTITHVVDETTFASQLSSMFPTLAFLAPSVRYQGIWKRSNLTRHHPLVTLRQTQLRNSSHSH